MSSSPTSLPATAAIDPTSAGMPQILAVLRGTDPAAATRWCSLRPKTDAERALYIQALEGQGVGYEAALNLELPATDVAFVRREQTDPNTGEVTYRNSSILFTADGRHFGGQSGPVGRAVLALIDLFGLPPWNPPVVVRIRAVSKGPEQRMFFLDFLRREEVARGSSTRKS